MTTKRSKQNPKRSKNLTSAVSLSPVYARRLFRPVDRKKGRKLFSLNRSMPSMDQSDSSADVGVDQKTQQNKIKQTKGPLSDLVKIVRVARRRRLMLPTQFPTVLRYRRKQRYSHIRRMVGHGHLNVEFKARRRCQLASYQGIGDGGRDTSSDWVVGFLKGRQTHHVLAVYINSFRTMWRCKKVGGYLLLSPTLFPPPTTYRRASRELVHNT